MSIRRASGRGGFTLVETVVAAGVSAVLMLALGSTVMIAARAVPTGEEAFITAARTERGIALLQSEVETAVDFYADANGIYITSADRDSDGVEEFVTYTWSGGDRMMTRTYDNGGSEALFGPLSSVTVKPAAVDGRLDTVSIVLAFSGAVPPGRTVTVRMLNQPVER